MGPCFIASVIFSFGSSTLLPTEDPDNHAPTLDMALDGQAAKPDSPYGMSGYVTSFLE